MQSKAAKIGYIVILVLAGIGFLWLKKYGPDSFSHKDSRKRYENYVKTEATIVSQDGNGRVGEGASTIWTIQYTDKDNQVHTEKMLQNSFMPKKNGEKIIIYYDPKDPGITTDEKDYNEVMP